MTDVVKNENKDSELAENGVVVSDAMAEAFFGIWVEWCGQGDNAEDMELGVTPDLKGLLESVLTFLVSHPRPPQVLVITPVQT